MKGVQAIVNGSLDIYPWIGLVCVRALFAKKKNEVKMKRVGCLSIPRMI